MPIVFKNDIPGLTEYSLTKEHRNRHIYQHIFSKSEELRPQISLGILKNGHGFYLRSEVFYLEIDMSLNKSKCDVIFENMLTHTPVLYGMNHFKIAFYLNEIQELIDIFVVLTNILEKKELQRLQDISR